MGVTKIRQNLTVAGSIKIGSGADVAIVRTAADKLGLASGDTLDLKTNDNNIQLPGSTTAIGTAAMGSGTNRLRVGTNGGTACLAFELNGTTFAVHATGNL